MQQLAFLAWVQGVLSLLLEGLCIEQVAAAIGGSSQQPAWSTEQQTGACLLHWEASLWAQQRQDLPYNKHNGDECHSVTQQLDDAFTTPTNMQSLLHRRTATIPASIRSVCEAVVVVISDCTQYMQASTV